MKDSHLFHAFKIPMTAMIAITSLLLGTSLTADDTEIFVGGGTSVTGVKPNVLFILDNSGSMSGSSYDEFGRRSPLSRMESMKLAFEDVMKGANGINVGLMSFNGSGGSMMYPVQDIDKELTSEAEQESNIGMTSGADDAVELKTSGNVYIDDETLTIAHLPNREVGKTIVAFLAHENDDGEQGSNGTMYTNGHYQFNMGSNQLNGLRYTNLGIPQGAQILSAHVEFTASRWDDEHIHIRIWGQDRDNPGEFTSDSNDISDRLANQTTNFVDWQMDGDDIWVSGRQYDTPDITSVVQEIVNRSDWYKDDAMVLLFEQFAGTGHRAGTLRREDRAETQGLDGSGSLLHVTYKTGAPAVTDQTVGLRFANIGIPAGAIVTNARIDFVSAAANPNPDSLNIAVKVENTGDAVPFKAEKNNLSNRTKFSDVVTWHPDDSWDFDQTVTGPDVTQLVQRVVSDAGSWCGGNAMAFFMEPSTSSDVLSRLAYSYDAGTGTKPTLTVSYTGGENGCIQRSWSSRVTNGENDAHQSGSNSTAYNSTNTLRFDSNNYVGLRFESLPIEPGKQVVDAYIELTSSDDDGGNTTISIKAHDTGNAPAFPQSKRNISNRNTTSAEVNWALTEDWEEDVTYRSPDISAVINEVLGRSDWQVGNPIALIMRTNNSNDRDFWSENGNSGKAAKLVIRAESGGITTSTNTVRWHEIELVNDLDPRGMTPATGALYEAARYFSGKSVDYGQTRNGSRYGRISHPDSWTGGSVVRSSNCSDSNLDSSNCSSEYIGGSPIYDSPITSSCQTSHVVLLTDGAANQNQATNRIGTLIGDTTCSGDANIGGEKCARSLARWMSSADLMPSLSGSVNSVNTHTVAFNLSSPVAVNFLSDLAQEGQGGFYNVNTAQDLTTAFDSILQSVRSTAATFVAPGATVNQFNRLSHRAEVYFSVFKPDSTPRWAGNLKRYKLLGNPAVISDANDKAAVDVNTGFFRENAQSVWSESPDGAVVAKGGAANQRPMDPDDLNIYTWLPNASIGSNDLTHTSNKVHESNTAITQGMLNVGNTTERSQLLRWTRGVDISDADQDGNSSETRREYADPLHSVPRIITYGGTDAEPETVIYFGTNGGYLHAVDGETGEEIFSFIPESQFMHMSTRLNNTALFTHPYGVDGSPASWVHDVDGDNQIEPGDGDFAYLYFGLRRGGNEYFALDVSTRDKPKLMWHIQGGSGKFTELGQSWSTPIHAKIRDADGIRDVLVIGGGYDDKYDDATFAGATTTGNAVYVIDALTGERLWYASSNASSSEGQRMSDLQYPIPSDISIIDINGDGLAEQIYAADLGGQILRFDVNTAKTGPDWINGGVIADLSTSSTPNNRRFFNAPDISLTSIKNTQKLAIAIGSGSRPTPLSRSVQDRFYVLLQNSVFRAPATYEVISNTDLIDQTSEITQLEESDSGWYFDLPNSGEKVLSSSVTVAGKVIMTTYSPDAIATSCNPVVGTGRAYLFNINNASAVADLDEDDSLEDTQDRSKTLASGNIPPSPKVLFPEDGAPTVLVGPEQPLQNVGLGLIDEWTQIYRRPEDPE